jgi:hypothetical protein
LYSFEWRALAVLLMLEGIFLPFNNIKGSIYIQVKQISLKVYMLALRHVYVPIEKQKLFLIPILAIIGIIEILSSNFGDYWNYRNP